MNQTVKLLLFLGGPNVVALVQWIEKNRKKHEEIDVFAWVDSFWYIVIKDTTSTEGYPGNLAIGFTVDLKKDSIFWTNQRHLYGGQFPSGGNIFCRSERWFRRLRAQYPEATSDKCDPRNGTVNDYRPRRERKPVIRAGNRPEDATGLPAPMARR